MNLLEKYYHGITQQIRGEVDFINSIFDHSGVKGDGNEKILRDLLKKFIPGKYGIGTGIIIDKNGKQSKQIDIIIYEKMMHPSILSLTSVHLFPVDIVYATIEVKTTLRSSDAKNCIENSDSVKALDLVSNNFTIGASSQNGFQIQSCNPTHPLSFIFSYNSEPENFETFKNWFVPRNECDIKKYPSIIACLDQGLVLNNEIHGKESKARAFALRYEGDKAAEITSQEKKITHNGIIYPVKTINGRRTLIDQSRVLLTFVVMLSEMIQEKFINPSIKFSQNYFDLYTTFGIDV